MYNILILNYSSSYKKKMRNVEYSICKNGNFKRYRESLIETNYGVWSVPIILLTDSDMMIDQSKTFMISLRYRSDSSTSKTVVRATRPRGAR